MTKILNKIIYSLLVFILLITPIFLNAEGENNPPGIGVKITNPFKCEGTNCSLMGLILAITENIVMPIAAVMVTLWIIWAGFGFLMAQGKPVEIDKAKQRLLWSLIGAGILLGAVGIAKVIENTVGAIIVP